MDTAWIQVFVLTLSECVAPSGKAVCQEQETQYRFADLEACEAMLDELMAYRSHDPNIIVNSARCLPTVVEGPVFASLEEADQELAGLPGWGVLRPGEAQPRQEAAPQDAESLTAHQQRLAALPECDAATSVTPCKVGQIIVEGEDEQELEIWRRDQ